MNVLSGLILRRKKKRTKKEIIRKSKYFEIQNIINFFKYFFKFQLFFESQKTNNIFSCH